MHTPSDPRTNAETVHRTPHRERSDLCVACGGYHGSVGVSFHCLENAVRSLRAALAEARRTPR